MKLLLALSGTQKQTISGLRLNKFFRDLFLASLRTQFFKAFDIHFLKGSGF